MALVARPSLGLYALGIIFTMVEVAELRGRRLFTYVTAASPPHLCFIINTRSHKLTNAYSMASAKYHSLANNSESTYGKA
jgi:hypothetical protein